MELQNLGSKQRSIDPFLGLVLSFAPLLGFFLTLNHTALQNNYIYEELMMLGEKALLVFHGAPPRLENLGFVYPPLIYTFVVIFRSPLVASAFVGGLCASLLIFYLYKAHKIGRVPPLLFPIVLLFILGTPSSLFILSEHQSLCLFSAVFLQLTYHLYRYCRYHYTFDLLLFGMMTAFLFFLRFQAIFLVPLLILPFIFSRNEISAPEKLSIIMVAFFPSIFFISSWSYLNWIFMGDPLYFFKAWLNSVGSATSKDEVAGDMLGALSYSFERIKEMLPLIFPFIVTVARQAKIGYRRCKVSPSVLAAPPSLMIFDAFFGVTHEHSMSYSILFLLTALACWMYIPLEERTIWFDRALIVSFILTFAFNWALLNKYPEEQAFIKALEKPLDHSTIKSAKTLIQELDQEGNILIDDARGFPLVFFEGNPRRFILPYQYEYETVLSSPYLFVRYVVVSSTTIDRVAGRWQEALYGNLHGFKLIGTFGHFILYERIPDYIASTVP
ncbi:MAG: hypothetical protein N2260_02440 [Syntrophobacterales bacterium]|nr:hypothetical protein [Syntrophobacterales bacterium]